MASTKTTPASAGPIYAPEDPSLPQPWKGLIDTSTNNLYYWNTETNITQYERPSAPPLPMALPETVPASAGSSIYAPEDPTLPQRWKGLIDTRNNTLYYWNAETNITQYERPSTPPSTTQQVMQYRQLIEQLIQQYGHSQQQYMGYWPYMQPQVLQNIRGANQGRGRGRFGRLGRRRGGEGRGFGRGGRLDHRRGGSRSSSRIYSWTRSSRRSREPVNRAEAVLADEP